MKQEKLSLTKTPNKIKILKKRLNKINNFKRIIFAAFLLLLVFPLMFSFKQQNSSTYTEEFCRILVSRNISEIIKNLEESTEILKSGKSQEKKMAALIKHYRYARKYYKEIEFFTEYYSPFDSKFYINGPLVPKIEMEISSQPFPPQGFQVIEETLFDPDKLDFSILRKEYGLLISKLSFLKEHYSTINIEKNKIQDALKLQIIRIMCLTLNGYDCTVNKESITECAYALGGLEKILITYKESADPKQDEFYSVLIASIKTSKNHLLKHPDSDKFDRLNFMVTYLNPLYKNLINFFDAFNIKKFEIHYAVNFRINSFFEANSINKQYFSVYVADSVKLKEQADLGRLLFFDPILSGNNRRACASCHQDTKAFADGLDKGIAFDGEAKLPRNVPTLINAAYQKLYFHDGRSFNLEEQANAVFVNKNEMNSDEKEIVKKLKQSKEYRDLFFEAFKNKRDTSITPYAVLKCLSEFIKTLNSRNSKFDKYLRGDKKQLSAEEINGYNLFSGKALCGSCHFFPLFNGTVPPMYNDNEFEVIGTPEKMNSKNIDADPGRKTITHSSIHDHAFKTPSLRNIELTGPYMHNGVYPNLDSVLVFYNRGGGAGSGFKVENQTLPFDSLGLSKKELNDLKRFLVTLSDTTGLPRSPKRLPEFQNAILNKRKIGGEY